MKKIIFFKKCDEYKVGLWQCPQFLFFIMGIVIIVSIIVTNVVARRFLDNEIVALIVLVVTAFLFVMDYIIVSSFEKLAESAKNKTDFIEKMSRCLQNPLSVIKWNLNHLKENWGSSEDDVKKSFKDLDEQVSKLSDTVFDFLILRDTEAGTAVFSPKPFDIKKLIEEIIKNKESITFSAPDNFPLAMADMDKIKIVVSYLLENAIKYSSSQDEISIVLEQFPNDIRCSINDKGIGITKDEQKKIFEKFFRGSESDRCQTDGTGLGLYLSRAIVEQSKGKIGFNSIEGQGSTFWFTLPIGNNKI